VSQENVEAVQRLYDAFNRGDVEAVLGCFADDLVFHEPDTLPHGGAYRGPAGMQEFLGKVLQHWEEGAQLVAEEIVDGGDTVVTRARYRARARATGIEVDVPMAEVVRVRDGKWTEAWVYPDTALMLRALEGEPAASG
jgi:uncharacterized protein